MVAYVWFTIDVVTKVRLFGVVLILAVDLIQILYIRSIYDLRLWNIVKQFVFKFSEKLLFKKVPAIK